MDVELEEDVADVEEDELLEELVLSSSLLSSLESPPRSRVAPSPYCLSRSSVRSKRLCCVDVNFASVVNVLIALRPNFLSSPPDVL
ncbi:hypothetical protein HC823_01725 [Candidatus Gracilibacteria bacterium]|nr:hypothetical protein [Candidatus Gracilibacteria bacterium]